MTTEGIVKPASSQIYPPGLYIVATPIGNLKDITLRALDILNGADLIVCEDTRVTGKLLSHYGIKVATLSYNDHNAQSRRPRIMRALTSGKRVALVSDAGTPLISDPGYKLVQEAQEQGVHISTLPGPSSALAGLCLAGLPTNRFLFAGFLPAKKEVCRREIAALAKIPATLIFFEAARRLRATLALLLEELGNRDAAVVREISKLHEESRRAPLAALSAYYEEHGAPRGEIVIVVAPPLELDLHVADNLEAKLSWLLQSHSVKDAATILARQTGRPRKEIYALALQIMGDDDDDDDYDDDDDEEDDEDNE